MNEGTKPLIAAVSGGIDSVVMLHKLVAANEQRLVVAHIDHGIREDSSEDEVFVASLAKKYELEFTSVRLDLGSQTSEDVARRARYAWLEEVCEKYQASAIATAHHQDDVLETMVINLVRGTGWRGLCSLRETATRRRPILSLSKAEIVEYALAHDLEWREDSTNESFRYLRNRIRSLVIPRLTASNRVKFLELYDSQLILRQNVDTEITTLRELYIVDGMIERHVLTVADDAVAIELLRGWLGESLEQSRFRDLLLFAKVARPGTKWSLDDKRYVLANQRTLIVSSPRD